MKTFRLVILSALLLAGTLGAQPVVTAVLDGAALTNNIAQGSVFVVKGTNLSNSGYVEAPAPAYPTLLSGVSISLTPASGGNALPMLMSYNYNFIGNTTVVAAAQINQLRAIIPSTVATGSYNLRVTSPFGTSAPFAVTVVQRKPGIVSSTGDGQGIAQATLQGQAILQRTSAQGKIGDFDTRPAHPSDVVTLWMTGLGPDTAADSGTGTLGDQTTAGQIRVVLNGIDIIPSYAGRSFGYPGLDQVNFTLPADVPLKCENTVQVRAAGTLSNSLTIATSAASATSCPTTGTGGGSGACPARANSGAGNPEPSQAEINEWIATGQECAGAFSVSRTISYTADYTKAGNPVTIARSDTSAAQFTKITGSDLGAYLKNTSPPPGYSIPAPGVCNIFGLNTVNPYPNILNTYLDGGDPLTVRGPNGSKALPRSTNSVGNIGYNATTGAGVPGNWMDPGPYTFTGPGSAAIGSFSVNTIVPTEFVVTNATALSTNAVNRASGLTVTWTGGDASTLVFITGSSYVTTSAGTTGASFQCYENNTAGRFTVPVSVLQQVPASAPFITSGVSITFPGSIGVSSITKTVRGYATGTDYFTFASSYNYSFNPLYQ
ncbi:MAG: hypothetical protein ABI824_01205 [Acidobacteriota bacterium]